jgi:UDP-N-acetylmuramoylalanine--D-glutamate ligase
MFDQKISAEKAASLNAEFKMTCYSGELNENLLADFDLLVLSPGIALNQPLFKNAIKAGKRITSDIELFVNETTAKLIGITGSNGKTTVTTWVTKILKKLGVRAVMGGNVGTPVLDLLNAQQADVVVLELSSFQLDLYKNIPLDIAVILNITQDHLDRYDDFAHYQRSKLSICDNAKQCLVDLPTSELLKQTHKTFGVKQGDYRITQNKSDWSVDSDAFSYQYSNTVLLNEVERLNALIVLSIATLFKITPSSVDPLLKSLKGLVHRNQLVANIEGIKYVNDSKGTNVGASIAAIKSQNTPVVLIAGGLAKGADFSDYKTVVNDYCKAVVLIGEDAQLMDSAINHKQTYFEASLVGAMTKATDIADAGDTVLLSPACASFDMFSNYQERGFKFIAQVEKMQGLQC